MTPDRAALSAMLAPEKLIAVEKLHGDGSARAYWRVTMESRPLILLVGPDRAENAAWARINRHLSAAGVRVPEIAAEDQERGWIVMEDLGDVNLLSHLRAGRDVREAYAEVLDLLLRMQVVGAKGFALETGFAAEPYGPKTMVEEEGKYFLREFAEGVLGLTFDRAAIESEFVEMAAEAAKAPANYLLHRDFQSRNIHLAAGRWAVIDFQGARPGPLAYDAAALILDPYAALPPQTADELLARYVTIGRDVYGVDVEAFLRSWPLIASFRLMQALGAYGKLGHRFGKPGFLEHSGAALKNLYRALADPSCSKFKALADLVGRCRAAWQAKT